MPKYSSSAHPSRPAVPLCGVAYLHRPSELPPSEKTGATACHEDTHSLKQCKNSFINASSCLNPDPGQLGDDNDAYRRWQARMIRYRREDKTSRSNNQKNQETIAAAAVTRVVNTRAKASKIITTTATRHTEQGNQQSGSGRHGGVPPSTASSAVAPASGIRHGASHNPGGNPNACQPSVLRTGN